jgi:hypothetical protein
LLFAQVLDEGGGIASGHLPPVVGPDREAVAAAGPEEVERDGVVALAEVGQLALV